MDKTKEEKITYYEAVGRRKTSTARARLYVVKDESMQLDGKEVKKGEMIVNARPVENYFPGEVLKKMYTEPFRTTNTVGRFVVSIKTNGGGLYSQLGAFIHAVSRALEKVDKEKFRQILKKRGFMTRDPRAKERRKYGLKKARKAPRWAKR